MPVRGAAELDDPAFPGRRRTAASADMARRNEGHTASRRQRPRSTGNSFGSTTGAAPPWSKNTTVSAPSAPSPGNTSKIERQYCSEAKMGDPTR